MAGILEESLALTTNFLKVDALKEKTSGVLEWKNALGQPFHVFYGVKIEGGSGVAAISYEWPSAGGMESIFTEIKLKPQLSPGNRVWWKFYCPLQKKGCRKAAFKLFLGKGKHFGCRKCVNVDWRCHQPSQTMRYNIYLRHPERIKTALSSPYVSAKEKIKAFDACALLLKRLERLKKRQALMGKAWWRKRQRDSGAALSLLTSRDYSLRKLMAVVKQDGLTHPVLPGR